MKGREEGANLLPPLQVELRSAIHLCCGTEVLEDGEEDIVDNGDDAHDLAEDRSGTVVSARIEQGQNRLEETRGREADEPPQPLDNRYPRDLQCLVVDVLRTDGDVSP